MHRWCPIATALVLASCGGEDPAVELEEPTVDLPAPKPSLDFIKPTYEGPATPRVLFHVGHGESFDPTSGLPRWLAHDGYRVSAFAQPLPNMSLMECILDDGLDPDCDDPYFFELLGARALVIQDPQTTVSARELDGLLSGYVYYGGALVVAASNPSTIHDALRILLIEQDSSVSSEAAVLNTNHPALRGHFEHDVPVTAIVSGRTHGLISPDDPAVPDDIYPNGLYQPVISHGTSLQGLTVKFGQGYVYFTTDTDSLSEFGRFEPDNVRFAINMMHWLEGGRGVKLPNLDLAIIIALLVNPFGAFVLNAQSPDPNFKAPSPAPPYDYWRGPTVLVDAAHNNFHTVAGRYKNFGLVLSEDGYVVRDSPTNTTFDQLLPTTTAKILVMANAALRTNQTEILSAAERTALLNWVEAGGSFFFIADHNPYSLSHNLFAAELGIEFAHEVNGANGGVRVIPERCAPWVNCRINYIAFAQTPLSWDGSLNVTHPVVTGRNASESIPFARTFTGTAIRLTGTQTRAMTYEPIATLPPGSFYQLDMQGNLADASGQHQAIAIKLGAGRIFVAAEAAEFTAQVAGIYSTKVGMNEANTPHNAQYLRNIIHWLDGIL